MRGAGSGLQIPIMQTPLCFRLFLMNQFPDCTHLKLPWCQEQERNKDYPPNVNVNTKSTWMISAGLSWKEMGRLRIL